MSKYVRGVKRNQIIQRWLQGIDDPDYEVFPTKKEGKYIVKPRTNPLNETNNLSDPVNEIPKNISVNEPNEEESCTESDPQESERQPQIQQFAFPKGTLQSKKQTSYNESMLPQPSKSRSRVSPVNRRGQVLSENNISRRASNHDSISEGNFAPQTINLEILEQLRSLGEELRNDRFKKEQKQYIKQVVNKELSKSRIRSKYIPDTLMPENPDHDKPEVPIKKESEPVETVIDELEPPICEPERPIFKSRIRR